MLLNRIFDVLWIPFSRTPHYLDLIIISVVSAFIFLLIFKKTSNQKMIRRYKNKMIGHLLEIRLYKDQPVITLKSILQILWCNVVYVRYMLVPLTLILLPLLVTTAQINNRYGYSPLRLNGPFIIRADLAKDSVNDGENILGKIHCEASDGILIETPALRIQPEAKIFWRARIINPDKNPHFIRLAVDGKGQMVEKAVFASRGKQRFSPERRKWHMGNFLLSSAEDFIPETSPFDTLSVNYARAAYPFLIWNVDPLVLYFLLTLIFAFVFKPFLKVNI